MHPALPILLIGALVSFLEDEPKAPERPAERIVLLPGADGSTGAVTVITPDGETLLDRPYAAADVFAGGKVAQGDDTAATVRERFGAALDARPPAPVSFTVYFVFDKDELTAESIAQFARIEAELAARPAPEIVVIGHTDRVGSIEYNDALSLKRAERVRAALNGAGVSPAELEVAGRGEREPAVATADEVDEPRNRRVEIMVR
jgi:outer membrane protein OmpA-like peptidoglycan-associated protein